MTECIGTTPLETKCNVLGRTKEIKISDRNKQKQSSETQVKRPGGKGWFQRESVLILHADIFKNCLISYLNNYYLEDRILSLPRPPSRFSFYASLGKYPNHETKWGCKWMLNTLGRISFHLFCFIFSSPSCEPSLITRLKKKSHTFKTGNICCCQHAFSTCRNEHGKCDSP